MSIKNYILSFTVLSSMAVSGCTLFPVTGPHSDDIRSDASLNIKLKTEDTVDEAGTDYALVQVTKPLITTIEAGAREKKLTDAMVWPAQEEGDNILVAVGDRLSITVFESRPGGLFVPLEPGINQGNFVDLPSQTIDENGYLTIPYAGRIEAAGKFVHEIEQDIVQKLQRKAIDPQIVISFEDRGGSEISVVGAVNAATRYSLNFNKEKVLDAIARAGGPNIEGYETMVNLQRNGREYEIRFPALMEIPAKNVYLKPNDTVYLSSEPETFALFGATGFAGEYQFNTRHLKLSEALARGQGLNDLQADPSEVYVYRLENKSYIDQLIALENDDQASQSNKLDLLESQVPTAYKFDLREGGGFFLTQQFPIEDGDIVYVGNAETVEVLKFLSLLNPGSVTTVNTRTAGD